HRVRRRQPGATGDGRPHEGELPAPCRPGGRHEGTAAADARRLLRVAAPITGGGGEPPAVCPIPATDESRVPTPGESTKALVVVPWFRRATRPSSQVSGIRP